MDRNKLKENFTCEDETSNNGERTIKNCSSLSV